MIGCDGINDIFYLYFMNYSMNMHLTNFEEPVTPELHERGIS